MDAFKTSTVSLYKHVTYSKDFSHNGNGLAMKNTNLISIPSLWHFAGVMLLLNPEEIIHFEKSGHEMLGIVHITNIAPTLVTYKVRDNCGVRLAYFVQRVICVFSYV